MQISKQLLNVDVLMSQLRTVVRGPVNVCESYKTPAIYLLVKLNYKLIHCRLVAE